MLAIEFLLIIVICRPPVEKKVMLHRPTYYESQKDMIIKIKALIAVSYRMKVWIKSNFSKVNTFSISDTYGYLINIPTWKGWKY